MQMSDFKKKKKKKLPRITTLKWMRQNEKKS